MSFPRKRESSRIIQIFLLDSRFRGNDKDMSQENENLISLKEASKNSPYSSDYLGLLVRKGKIEGEKKDGKWMTTRKAVENYLNKVAEASYERQGTLNVKVPAAENKKTLTNLKWSLILASIVIVILVMWGIDTRNNKNNQYEIEKDSNNNLIIHVDDPSSIRSVTVVPKIQE